MSQLTTAVLKDSAGVDHTFSPRGITDGVATLANSSGVPIGDLKVTASRKSTTAGRERAIFKITLPIVQTVAGANGISKPTVVRQTIVDLAFNFDSTSSTLERTDALAYAKNLLASAQFVSMVQDLDAPY